MKIEDNYSTGDFMETKSVIAIQHGKVIKAVMCETGDYVDLAPRLQKYWKDENKVQHLIDQGYQKSINDFDNVPSDTKHPAMTFYNFTDFMRYFEKDFCEDYYILAENIWYYTGIGYRTVDPLEIKLLDLTRIKSDPVGGCLIHSHL